MFHHAAYIIGPAQIGVADDRLIQRKLILLVLVIGGQYADLAIVTWSSADHGLIINGAGQDEAVVVIGVFTDQIDSARSLDRQGGGVAKVFGKQGLGKLF
ncbi:hypothetical protein D3C75_1082130 [compost metagenome]